MKIKRFEASSMSEALRNIKKEFGEDAVILSAKTVKKSSLLGKKKSDQVIVTAAIDKVSPVLSVSDEQRILQGDERSPKDQGKAANGYNRINILKRFNPITLTGQKKLKPKIVELMKTNPEQKKERFLFDRLLAHGLNETHATEMERQVNVLLTEDETNSQDHLAALIQVFDAYKIVGYSNRFQSAKQRIVIMLGPAGSGKTTAVAKMCAQHILHHNESVALISLDNQRVAGTTELERYARILGVPLRSAFDAKVLTETVTELSEFDLIIVDTPGLTADDYLACEKMRRLLDVLKNAERYLLIGADIQEKTMARTIALFKPIGIHGLYFTRLDWVEDMGPIINQSIASHLPVAFISDSPKVPDGIKVASAYDMASRIVPDQGENTHTREDETVTVINANIPKQTEDYYVANRNSDIFHLKDCKSVNRINTENIVVFKDPAEAMGLHFKPCRMCCSELIFPKPVDRLARGYAGNRYQYK